LIYFQEKLQRTRRSGKKGGKEVEILQLADKSIVGPTLKKN